MAAKSVVACAAGLAGLAARQGCADSRAASTALQILLEQLQDVPQQHADPHPPAGRMPDPTKSSGSGSSSGSSSSGAWLQRLPHKHAPPVFSKDGTQDASSSHGSSSSSSGASSSSSGSGSSSSSSSKASGAAGTAATPAADPLTAALLALSKSSRDLTPAAITKQLDKHIVGQANAKRAVAVALRNRWRRHKLPADVAEEITPKNILMVGPTGCGKTEIARRLAKLVDAPFVKVEATKFTELGFVGRDVDEIVKDLAEAALAATRIRLAAGLRAAAAAAVEELLLRELCGHDASGSSYETFRPYYRSGALDDRPVEVDMAALGELGGPAGPEAGLAAAAAAAAAAAGLTGGGPGGGPGQMPSLGSLLEAMARRAGAGGLGGRQRGNGKVKMTIGEARKMLLDVEVERALGSERVVREALRSAQEDGIVFIDEIDKIVDSSRGAAGATSSNVSSEGVQRDLLPILEGSVVSTKYGNVSTDHVLFIASGAFHSAKPGDMLAELQGRLPVRVELSGLTADDFYRILTEPQHNMIRQQQTLLATEGVSLTFTDGAVRAVARAAEQANRLLDNIGARRLHTVLERVLADISFSAPDRVAAAKQQQREQQERERAAAGAAGSSEAGGKAAGAQQGSGKASSKGSKAAGRASSSSSNSSASSSSPEAGKFLVHHEVTEAMVDDCMKELLKHQDLSRYVL